MAGIHAKYGNAQGDSHALCESWIGQCEHKQGAHEFIPRTGYIGIWIHPGPAEIDSWLVRRAMPAVALG